MARERTNYGKSYYRYRSPERKALDTFYENIKRFAGETLTIEKMVIKTVAISMRTVTVRYDADTAFELNLYHHDLVKLQEAGYELPTTMGEFPFHAEVIFKWTEVLREYRLVIDTVLPKTEAKEDTMETVQPETTEPVLTVVETPATLDTAAIISELSRLQDMLANSPTILGLTGDALTVATAKQNAAHYIGNAISSLERALPVPAIAPHDVTERIPEYTEIMAAGDTGSEEAA